MTSEELFPRGGKIIRKRPAENKDTLFSPANQPTKAKKTKKRATLKESSQSAFEATLNIQGTLTYKKIQPGLLVLSCVRRITSFALEVELPGLCFAIVPITEISDTFTKNLNEQLENQRKPVTLDQLFTIGEYLPIKVLKVEEKDKGTHVEASTNPREIYSEQSHNLFKKDMLIWSSVVSKSDHGYEMNVGVKNTRAFLPFKNTDKEYIDGKPLWGVIHKVDSTILRLSARVEHIKATKYDYENLDTIIPGSKVSFMADKLLPHGIQGKFQQFIGYIDESYLHEPLKQPENYREGKLLYGYLMYVEPTTKIAYLSLRFDYQNADEPTINVGEIIRARVWKKTFGGLFFSLPNQLKGFATNRRLLNSIKSRTDDLPEAISNKYPLNSWHQCRILDYNRLSQMYIMTTEVDVVKNIFLPSELICGQLIDGRIDSIKDDGIVISSNNIRGFVPNLHLSNSAYSESIKTRFKEGQKIQAKVLTISQDNNLWLTLKPALIDAADCLKDIEEAEIGQKYTGVVTRTTPTGAQIVFYNKTKGFLAVEDISKQSMNVKKFFFIGQIVQPYVKGMDNGLLQLSLLPPDTSSTVPVVGKRYTAIIKAVTNAGVKVAMENTSINGFVPTEHLSDCLLLCEAIKSTLLPKKKLPQVMYVGGTDPYIFSRREALGMICEKVLKLNTLKQGDIVRCSVVEQDPKKKCLIVMPLIQGSEKLVTIERKYGGNQRNLVKHQLLMAKVMRIEEGNLVLSIHLKDVFNKTVETMLFAFAKYMAETSLLYRYGRKNDWKFCRYNIGEQVQGKILEITAIGCKLILPDSVECFAPKSLCPKSLKEGAEITGIVLARDYQTKSLDVCLRPDISSKINPDQDGVLSGPYASARADKLLIKNEYIIALLRHPKGNKQLVYLPLKVHPNDFEGCAKYYEQKKFKVCVCCKTKRSLVGMHTKLFLELDKSKKVTKEVKRKSSPDSGIDDEEPPKVVEIFEEPAKKVLKQDEIVLPGISSFFNASSINNIEDSSSDEEGENPVEKKKRKLTQSERAAEVREEEERISKIERHLADLTKQPESPEQFDRILLSKPDSAEIWAKYIAFYVSGTEIDKARAVARRALETINMTLTEEKFQIWTVLINLEILFGTNESFDKTFDEAVKFNDPLQLYLNVIQALAENGKFTEMEEKIQKVRAKYRQDSTMWLEIAKTYYQINKLKEARQCKDRALRSITEKKSQMALIVRFALFEFKYGESDQGAAIFEAILTQDPRKVNIWMTYVDQLIKSNQIEEARQVLERAVSNKLPIKCMKTLFMKFRKFEEAHGTTETVEAVKVRAQEYLNQC